MNAGGGTLAAPLLTGVCRAAEGGGPYKDENEDF